MHTTYFQQTNWAAKPFANHIVPGKYTGIKQKQGPMAFMTNPFSLVWLDGNIDVINNEDSIDTIVKLKQVVNKVKICNDISDCINFIQNVKEKKVILISSGAFGKITVPIIHNMPQISRIYIFCGNKALHQEWAKGYSKIKGVFTSIGHICQALQQTIYEFDQSLVSISFFANDHGAIQRNLNQFDSSFMYTLIIKEIVSTINYKRDHVDHFITYYRKIFSKDPREIQNIDKFEQTHQQRPPIWWYTYPGFLSSMLNRSLGLMKIGTIIHLGFFIRALHKDITALHEEQYATHADLTPFIVYRGYDLSQEDFSQLGKMQGGFLSFNNFLLTSKTHQASLNFIHDTVQTSNRMGILFVMKIDPSITSTPFANIQNVSCFKKEGILFSIHPIFRIVQIKQMENNRLWEVDLVLTNNNDPEVQALNERMRKETYPDAKGWDRLGLMLIKFEQFSKAQALYEMLVKKATDDLEKSDFYHMLGLVKDGQGKYADAFACYKKSIQLKQNASSTTSIGLAVSFDNAGAVLERMADYSNALSFHQKALEIRKKSLPSTHPDLATSYECIGLMYGQLGDYSNALSSHGKALEIYRQILPQDHPDLGISYNNIGLVYGQMCDYSKALASHKKALAIYQKIDPPNYLYLATSYNNIGLIYDKMNDYSKALSFHQKALDIRQEMLPPNHPDVAVSYNNIGILHGRKGDFEKSIHFHQLAVQAAESSLPTNHHDIRIYKDNLELMKKKF